MLYTLFPGMFKSDNLQSQAAYITFQGTWLMDE